MVWCSGILRCMPGPVCSYNEWDPLEEVIVGTARGAAKPAADPVSRAYHRRGAPARDFPGELFTADEIAAAEAQLDALAALLAREGVVVQRPDPADHTLPIDTPDFSARYGYGTACPRDILLVVGEEIIEAPMAMRGRFFEYRSYRRLIKSYFREGAAWTAAPKPLMGAELYRDDFSIVDEPFDARSHALLTDHEPCFEAASFARCGRDLFWQPDLVSNTFGVEWLRRHLGPEFRIHQVEFGDASPLHIDATLVPIRPGLVIVHPDRPFTRGCELFEENGWEVITAPSSVRTERGWAAMNLLMLDEHTAVVEAAETPMIEFLESLDCRVLPCAFDHVLPFGGCIHCCTCDVRRRGPLRSYFPSLDAARTSPG